VTSTFIAASLAALQAVAPAEPCVASTTLDGPSTLVAPIARGLEAHGVLVGSAGTCPGRAVRATVTAASTKGFKLHIEDGYGRTSDRQLSEAGTAVSLIESWVVEEDSDLLAVAVPPAGPGAPTIVATAPPPAATGAALRLYGGIASAVGSDRSVWGGGLVGGCARLGPSCVGAELYAAHDLGLAGDTADAGTTRTAADLLVVVAFPLAKGRFLLMPSAGLGAGWMRTHVAAEDAETPAQTGNTVGPRGAVSIMGGVALSSHITLALGLGGVLAPTSRATPTDQMAQSTSTLPGEPRLSGRALIACVVTP
jgi:hypothetical protein